MKLLLLYQKTYFESSEWKELINSLKVQVSNIFLLSKNNFFFPLKNIKKLFLGECVLVEVVFSSIENLVNFINVVGKKYNARFFPICYILVYNNSYYFIQPNQLQLYSTFIECRVNSKELVSINNFFLYEFIKFFSYKEMLLKTGLLYLRENRIQTINSYYY